MLRWNRNYFQWLKESFGEPDEYGDNLKMAWSFENRKVIYHAQAMLIQLHERLDESGLKWKLIDAKQYPTKEDIKIYSKWLKGEFEEPEGK